MLYRLLRYLYLDNRAGMFGIQASLDNVGGMK